MYKIADGKCHPAAIRNEFNDCKIDHAFKVYQLIGTLSVSLGGDRKKLYPKFYKLFVDESDNLEDLSLN